MTVPVANGAASLRFTSDNKGRRSGFVASYVVLAAAACASDADCGGHGRCSAAARGGGGVSCVCARGWAGLACDSPDCLHHTEAAGARGEIVSQAPGRPLAVAADCSWALSAASPDDTDVDTGTDGHTGPTTMPVAVGTRLTLHTLDLEPGSAGDYLEVRSRGDGGHSSVADEWEEWAKTHTLHRTRP